MIISMNLGTDWGRVGPAEFYYYCLFAEKCSEYLDHCFANGHVLRNFAFGVPTRTCLFIC